MTGRFVKGAGTIVELAAVPGMGKSLEMAIEPDEAAREAAALAHQASQIVPEVGIASFDRVGFAFVIEG